MIRQMSIVEPQWGAPRIHGLLLYHGCEVAQYGPNEVKQAIAGWGGASKDEVERMVQTLLGIDRPLRPVDAADAVALALCHLAHAPMLARVQAGTSR